MTEKYVPPQLGLDGFHCPHCGVYSNQRWAPTQSHLHGKIKNLMVSYCDRCKNYAAWIRDTIIYPISSIAPLPIEDMPDDVKEDFLEARNIVNVSPRAAAALLRLALQKLMPHLGEKGENINHDIANLVSKGLSLRIQKALDSVRVIGNNAVHPGQIDLRDDVDTSTSLFELLNLIVDVLITQEKRIDKIYNKIPNSIKEAIKKRDKKT